MIFVEIIVCLNRNICVIAVISFTKMNEEKMISLLWTQLAIFLRELFSKLQLLLFSLNTKVVNHFSLFSSYIGTTLYIWRTIGPLFFLNWCNIIQTCQNYDDYSHFSSYIRATLYRRVKFRPIIITFHTTLEQHYTYSER